ncbi:MAG: hypothetical protein COZ69_07615 [Deltaproteobacteria bacterium CG_4_8_14_3_um_filter_45_9]|jgi:hypothetical protein|nr:MAG: hypothetical protein COS40_05410 [Deltaproteobacteria bacterium CG03_land_8_20_14_0_80_45_14]PIX23836.1 MAG: hypothetical protein COZ69_07615 [Deltaproteobacteria bacterium CG_4_8_14_3_um_filter_45_9]
MNRPYRVKSYKFFEKSQITNTSHESWRSCLRREWGLPFLEMRCNIFEIIYFDPSSLGLPTVGRGEKEGRNYEQG